MAASTPAAAPAAQSATPPAASPIQPAAPPAINGFNTGKRRLFDARPDTADFRDRMFEPTLVDVPTEAPLDDFLAQSVPVLDQGADGACTAFGLATVAHALLRRRRPQADPGLVSTRMFYDMARRYDEWEGESYSGSSCRGAMKAWHRHGVCADGLWPWTPGLHVEPYTDERARDALRNPLGAYARVNHRDLVAMHAAFAETGVLYASSAVHEGWHAPPDTGHVAWARQPVVGWHAFAVVGYDRNGFWIQNSWGTRWGRGGYGHVSYDEWLERGSDVWVARLAVPVELERASSAAVSNSPLGRQSVGYSQADLRPHVVSLGNNGALRCEGRFACTQDDVRNLVRRDMRSLTAGWKKKRVLLYAHGGLVPEDAAIQRVADYREAMLREEIYPLCFVWKTDLWTTLGNILKDAARPRSEGLFDRARDLLLDRLDDTIEPLARAIGGKAMWDEMKENALLATTAVRAQPGGGTIEHGGAAQVARLLDEWRREDPSVEIHIAAHSAGSILMAPLVQLFTRPGQVIGGPARGMLGMGGRLASLTLWAPAVDMDTFIQAYVPAISSRQVARASLFTLTDSAEQDDHCLRIYNKSLLYLVARAFEKQPRSWIDSRLRQGTPIAGMARFIEAATPADQAWGHERVRDLVTRGRLDWVQAPNDRPLGDAGASRATTHGGFDDDPATVQALIAFILDRDAASGVELERTAGTRGDHRRRVGRALVDVPR